MLGYGNAVNIGLSSSWSSLVHFLQVPVSSMNPELNSLLHNKRHIVVLNKADLVPSKAHKVCTLCI